MYRSLASGVRFRSLYRSGSRSRIGGITVYQSPHDSSIAPEVGFVAGKKVGNAVKRNRAKRRLRAAARQVPFAQGTSYVLVSSEDVLHAPFGLLIRWLEDAVEHGAARSRNG